MSPEDALNTSNYLSQQGVLGYIIIALLGAMGTMAGVIIWQQRRYDGIVKEKDLEIKGLYKAINDVQELRIKDNKDTILTSITANTNTNNALNGLKDSIKDSITTLSQYLHK